MININLEEYKCYLINSYEHECDNNEFERDKRKILLNSKYKNEYLENIIVGTYDFINKIIEISENNYPGDT